MAGPVGCIVYSILHMLFTLAVQLVIMRRFEKMLGWLRIIIIYTVCGMAANVFSAIFLPYFVTVSADYLLIYLFAEFCAHGTKFPRVEILRKE